MNKSASPTRIISALIAVVAVAFFIASAGHGRAAAQAPATFTVSGTVTDTNGAAMPDVMVILLSDVTGTQIAFTNQSGNYVLTYVGGVSHNLRIMPAKSGFIFNPLLSIFISSVSLSGDRTVSFVGTSIPILLVAPTPISLTQENSLRALALDSVTWASEPFSVAGNHNFSTDQHTRVSLFAVNLELRQGEPLSVIEAQAETSGGQIFPLTIEYFGAVPNFSWLKQVVVRLPDEIADSNEVQVSLKARGQIGNKVIVKVKP